MVGVPPILETPTGITAVTIAVVALLYYQRGLGWHDYRMIHKLKVRLAPLVDAYTDYFVLSEKPYRNKSPEYLGTRESGVKGVWWRLVESGSPHLVSSVKYRETPHVPGAREYAVGHVVWTHSDGTQTEAYLFSNGDGSTDVYCHHETSASDVDGHLEDGGVPGDPRNVVKEALGIGVED